MNYTAKWIFKARPEKTTFLKQFRGSRDLTLCLGRDETLSFLESLVSDLSRQRDIEALKAILKPYLELKLLKRLSDYQFIDLYVQELVGLWKEERGVLCR